MSPLPVILSATKDLAVEREDTSLAFGRDTARSFAALRTTGRST
jgi:hypothetical protein